MPSKKAVTKEEWRKNKIPRTHTTRLVWERHDAPPVVEYVELPLPRPPVRKKVKRPSATKKNITRKKR